MKYKQLHQTLPGLTEWIALSLATAGKRSSWNETELNVVGVAWEVYCSDKEIHIHSSQDLVLDTLNKCIEARFVIST